MMSSVVGLTMVAACPLRCVAQSDSDAMDYLIANVCVDEHGQPTLQNPLNTNAAAPPCARQRNLRPGEMLPYYPGSAGKGGPTRRYSFLSKTAGTDQKQRTFPIIVTWTDHNLSGHWAASDGVSLRTVEDGYASDLGSTGGETLSVNLGEGAATKSNKGIARFNKAWVFFPEKLLPLGGINYGTYSESIVNSPRDKFDPATLPSDPKLHSYFGVQGHQKFRFGAKSSLVMDALIGNKYAGRDKDGLSPGGGTAMERSYFTRELGDTRWEAWKRDDNRGGHILEHAHTLYELGSCGLPAQVSEGPVNPHFEMGTVQVEQTPAGPVYSQIISGWDDKEHRLVAHKWYMVHCADWSDVHPQKPIDLNAVMESPDNKLLKDILSVLVAP